MSSEFTCPKNLRFECNKCALCCGDTKDKTRHILLLDSESTEIAKKTDLDANKFSHEITGWQPYMREMIKDPEGKCVFLKDNACIIYDYRPLICRFYPFELKFNQDIRQYEFTATLECPAINKGKRFDETEFKKLFHLAQERLKQFSSF